MIKNIDCLHQRTSSGEHSPRVKVAQAERAKGRPQVPGAGQPQAHGSGKANEAQGRLRKVKAPQGGRDGKTAENKAAAHSAPERRLG